MGWALENLDPQRRKEIAEKLITVEKVYGTKLHGFCPVHGDKKSASAFYNWDLDSGSCKSCGEKWDLVKLWCLVNNLDPQDLKAFREEFDEDYTGGPTGRGKGSKREKRKPVSSPPPAAPEAFIDEADLEALPPLSSQTMEMLRRVRGWSPLVVKALDLRLFVDHQKKERIAIPIRSADGKLGNIRLYQPGADQFKVISWYDQKCKACCGSWKIVKKQPKVCKECGAGPNDYGRTRLFPPPSMWQSGTLWLCEGEPDTVCALSQGLNAVTQTAGCGTWREEFSEAMAGRDVVICYDADEAGTKGAKVAAESLVQHAKSVRVLVWPELMGRKPDKEEQ